MGRTVSRLDIPESAQQRAYLAGLFDGEGCITRTNRRPIVQIGMTHQGVIGWLGTIGGTVRVEQPPGNRRPLYRWRVLAANEVEEFLRAIFPYLIVKSQEAENAICEIEGARLIHEDMLSAQGSLL